MTMKFDKDITYERSRKIISETQAYQLQSIRNDDKQKAIGCFCVVVFGVCLVAYHLIFER